MESRVIKLTPAAHKHGNLNLSACGKDFFPPDVFGGPSKKAGIGGTRLAFEKADCQCVFSSEWDRFAQQTYEANFGEKPGGDIREIPSSEIPDHDIRVASFPDIIIML